MANGNGDTLNGTNGNGNGKISKAAVIGGNTLVPIGAVLMVFLAAWKVQSFLEDKFTAMQCQLNEIKKEYVAFNYNVTSQLDNLRGMMLNRWTSQDMKIWEQELKIKNPNINVPNSTDITRARATETR